MSVFPSQRSTLAAYVFCHFHTLKMKSNFSANKSNSRNYFRAINFKFFRDFLLFFLLYLLWLPVQLAVVAVFAGVY